MSAEHELNAAPSTAERAPAADYTPMPDSFTPAPEKKKTYDSDLDGVEKAARDLTEAREQGRVPRAEDEPIDRGYINYTTGERVPEGQTLEAQRAARDLKMVRDHESGIQNPHDPAHLALAVDNIRQAFPDKELPPNFVQDMQQVAEQVQQQQQQAQAQAAEPQIEQPQPSLPDGVDPEIAQALQNPKIRAALEAEVQAAEQARIQYAQGSRQAAQLAAAATLAQFPELANLSAAELPHAVNAIRQVNPAKATEIEAQLNRVKSLSEASQQAVAAQQQIQAQRLQEWVQAEDQKFSAATAHESPETMRKISEAAVDLAEEYGVSRQELAALWQSQPLLRSSAFQRIMADAARYRMAQRTVAEKKYTALPPVQRPGTAPLRNSDGDVESAMKHFRSQPSVDNAVQLLVASRAAKRR
jgi:hypothetical protein